MKTSPDIAVSSDMPKAEVIVACGLMVVVAARCLRFAFIVAHHMPSYAVRYVIAVWALFALTFGLIIAALLVRDLKLPRLQLPTLPPWLATVLRLAINYGPYIVVACVVGTKIYNRYGVPYIGTDGALFSRYAVDLVLAGKNPYSESMHPAFAAYNFDAPFSTYRIDGTTVEQVSYPAMSFLTFVPQALLGSRTVDATSLVILLVTFLWLVAKSDGLLRWAPPIILLAHGDILNFTAGGVFDILWVLPVLVTMQQWAREGELLTAGLAYGLACSVKQTPWFIAPFLLTALVLERKPAKDYGRFIGAAAAIFVVTNLPFMLSAPRQWLAGVMTPVAGGVPLVELGEGPILLNIIGATHEPKAFFTLLMVLAFAVCLWIYAAYYPRTKYLAWVAPMVILWFNYRSLHNYYLFSLPLAHFAVVLRGREPCADWPKRGRATAMVVAAAVAVTVIAGIILPARSMLPAKVTAIDAADPQGIGRNSRMRLRVENDGPADIEPVFLVTHVEHQTPFIWPAAQGPTMLAPGASAEYTLDAPAVQATLPIGASWHLRLFDRGHSAWSSLVVATERDPKLPRPLVKNGSFTALAQRGESGLYIPYEWATIPRRPTDQMHFEAKDDGMHLGNADTTDNENAALHQVLKVIPPSITIDATPSAVKTDTTSFNNTPGVELRDGKHCILMRFVDVETPDVRSGAWDQRDCRVIDVPAKAGERLTTTITFADFIDPAFIASMKGTVRLLLFAGVPSNGENAVTFHHVTSTMFIEGDT